MLGVRDERGVAGAGAVRPFHRDVHDYPESGGCSADVVRNAGFSLRAYLGEALVPVTASLVMAGAVVLLGHALSGQRPIFQLLAQVALGLAIYGGLVFIFAPRRLKELLGIARGLRP